MSLSANFMKAKPIWEIMHLIYTDKQMKSEMHFIRTATSRVIKECTH